MCLPSSYRCFLFLSCFDGPQVRRRQQAVAAIDSSSQPHWSAADILHGRLGHRVTLADMVLTCWCDILAGMVAESLRFGDCRGGREDLPLARSILRQYGVPRDQV